MKSFKRFLDEAVRLTPKELMKQNSSTGERRVDILKREIQAENPLELAAGGFFIVSDKEAAIDAINKFEKNGKPFELIGLNGSIKSSDLAKSQVFGGGSGGAGGGTAQTATVESAQCAWLQAMLDIGMQTIESFDDEVIKTAYSKIDVDVSLDDILSIDDSWRMSSYLSAKHIIENGFVHKGMVAHRGSKVMKEIYSAKNMALKNQGLSKISDDKWNPGDIWLVGKGFKTSELPTDTLGALNAKLVELFNDRKLVGVSLKKVKKSAKHTVNNLDGAGSGKSFRFKSYGLAAATRGTFWTSKNAYLYYDSGSMEIRTNAALSTHKAEIKGKTARGGGVGWGIIQNYSQTTLGLKLPSNKELVKLSKSINSGNSRSINAMWKMVKKLETEMSEQEFKEELAKKDQTWIHAKLGPIFMFDAMIKARSGKKVNKFVTQIVNYAGSELEESSVYVKVYE